MKIHMDFTVTLTEEQLQRVLELAKAHGFDHKTFDGKEPPVREIVKRVVRAKGIESLEKV